MIRHLLLLTLVLALAVPGAAQDGSDEPAPPAVPAPTAEEPGEPAEVAPLTFGDALDAARAEAKESGRPLLLVAIPDWYESPAWARLQEDVLGAGADVEPLRAFVRVLVRETRDREVHVRHRVAFDGYPLAVVLSSDGAYLGHTSGVPPHGDAARWIERVAAIPARAARIADLRKRLDASPEDPALLFELGKALAEAGESDRADALFERMEQADPLTPADRLGEARYLRLRHRVIDLLAEKKFGDVEGLCLRWQRRFADHARAPDVLLLQANAQFLAGQAAEARALWERIMKDHAESDAAKQATRALAGLKD